EGLSSIYPHLLEVSEIKLETLNTSKLANEVDIVFLATPAGVASGIVPKLQDSDVQIIDLSGDLRLASQTEYEEWYNKEAAPQSTLDNSVYGLTEIYKEKVNQAQIISNPGCFLTD